MPFNNRDFSIVNSPLIGSVFSLELNNGAPIPEHARFISTEDGRIITTENGLFLVTEG